MSSDVSTQERKKLTNKERMKIPRHPMPEQDPLQRAANFLEVPLGYTPEMAMEEAERCLQCKDPKCVAGCPVNVQIPEFIYHVAMGHFKLAAQKLKEDNALPAVCGRVCPQEEQCEESSRGGRGWMAAVLGEASALDQGAGGGVLPVYERSDTKTVSLTEAGRVH